jgi:phosphoribosyl 1,2-cyclic phosphate phosphodiesterase
VKVTFLGTGTSQGVPVIACGCEVCRSPDAHDKRLRVSVLIETAGKVLVIDTGPDFRYQMLRAGVRHLDFILLTHEHKDHIAGLDDVRAFNYFQQEPMTVYGHKRILERVKSEFHYAFSDHKYPGVPVINLAEIAGDTFTAEDVLITPVEVMHYRLPVWGYRIGDFTYITDAKTITAAEKEKIRGTRILVLNALQREPHISHFTLDEAVQLAREIGAGQTYLTHISHRMGLHQEVDITLPEGINLAFDGLTVEI